MAEAEDVRAELRAGTSGSVLRRLAAAAMTVALGLGSSAVLASSAQAKTTSTSPDKRHHKHHHKHHHNRGNRGTNNPT